MNTKSDKVTQACTAFLSIPAAYASGALFSINPGVPAKDALGTASIYLSIAADLAQNTANSSSDERDAKSEVAASKPRTSDGTFQKKEPQVPQLEGLVVQRLILGL
jgi:hypothetical protein